MTNADMTNVLEGVEKELRDDPAVPRLDQFKADKFVTAKQRQASGDTLEAIQQDWRKTLAELEQELTSHRKRLDAHIAACKAALDEMKRLAG